MNNKNEIIEFQPNVEIRKDVYISTEDYLNIMGNDKNWAVDIDISISAHIFGLNIDVYKNDIKKNFIEYLYSIISNDNENEIPLLILINENENHFELIKPKNEETNNENISDKKQICKVIIKDNVESNNNNFRDNNINCNKDGLVEEKNMKKNINNNNTKLDSNIENINKKDESNYHII